MYNHEPANYECPLCIVSSGGETEYNKQSDIVFENDDVLAFVSPKWWVNNPGNIMVIPKEHVENIYDISDELLAKVQVVGKKVALAMKEVYRCDATSFRQHNEPVGNQDVWHYHLHVFPRWEGDDLYINHKNKSFVEAEKREVYAKKIREYFNNNK
ncbi:HIT family protein [Candidatus Kaiserbacteria bacterium]|nr:HIT family protein [Candidatus Kaiserbacteria bacterium]